jgi:hypothetical protein
MVFSRPGAVEPLRASSDSCRWRNTTERFWSSPPKSDFVKTVAYRSIELIERYTLEEVSDLEDARSPKGSTKEVRVADGLSSINS